MAARRKDREQGIYRRVSVRMWGDAKVRALTRPAPCGQVLWVHLLTGEQTDIIPGLCKIGEAAFAEQLGWPVEGFREAFREVQAQGLAKADWEARVVWLPKAIEHNVPVSVNVVKSWADAWDRIPECALKDEARRVLRGFLEGMAEGFVLAFDEACPKASVKPSGIQEQEQEQEQEKLARSSRARARAGETKSPAPESQSPAKSDPAWANAGAPGGSDPAEHQDAQAPGEAGHHHERGAPPDSKRGAGAAPARAAPAPAAEDEFRPPRRPLRVVNLVDQPLVADFRERVVAALGHGVVVAKSGEEAGVAEELEEILAVQTVEQALRFCLTTARRQGVDPGSLAWCLAVLRDMPAPEDLRPPMNAVRWDELVALMTPAQRGELEEDKRQALADVLAMNVWNSESNRLLDAAEERLWAKWSPRVRPAAAGGA